MRLIATRRIQSTTGDIEPGTTFDANDVLGARFIEDGSARKLPDTDFETIAKTAGRWSGERVVCIASGPSLDPADCELVWHWRTRGSGKVIVVNSSYPLAPWADALYAGDYSWWRENTHPRFGGELWTGSERAHRQFGVRYAPRWQGAGSVNSGHQAVCLALHWGAREVILLGYDMAAMNGRQQWHEPYQNAVVAQPYNEWIEAFKSLPARRIVNCTRRSVLNLFPRIALQDELAATSALPAA